MGREQDSHARDTARIVRIASLNDALRRHGCGGMIGVTRGVASLADYNTKSLLAAVGEFNDFTPDNDPHGEHDFGTLSYAGAKLFWKIDYFAAGSAMTVASPDAANPDVTERLLTIMLMSEY